MSQDEVLKVLKKHPNGLLFRELDKILTNLSRTTITANLGKLIANKEVRYTEEPRKPGSKYPIRRYYIKNGKKT